MQYSSKSIKIMHLRLLYFELKENNQIIFIFVCSFQNLLYLCIELIKRSNEQQFLHILLLVLLFSCKTSRSEFGVDNST